MKTCQEEITTKQRKRKHRTDKRNRKYRFACTPEYVTIYTQYKWCECSSEKEALLDWVKKPNPSHLYTVYKRHV